MKVRWGFGSGLPQPHPPCSFWSQVLSTSQGVPCPPRRPKIRTSTSSQGTERWRQKPSILLTGPCIVPTLLLDSEMCISTGSDSALGAHAFSGKSPSSSGKEHRGTRTQSQGPVCLIRKTKVSQDDMSLLGVEEAPATAVPIGCTLLSFQGKSRDVLPFQEEKQQRLATVPPLTS